MVGERGFPPANRGRAENLDFRRDCHRSAEKFACRTKVQYPLRAPHRAPSPQADAQTGGVKQFAGSEAENQMVLIVTL